MTVSEKIFCKITEKLIRSYPLQRIYPLTGEPWIQKMDFAALPASIIY